MTPGTIPGLVELLIYVTATHDAMLFQFGVTVGTENMILVLV